MAINFIPGDVIITNSPYVNNTLPRFTSTPLLQSTLAALGYLGSEPVTVSDAQSFITTEGVTLYYIKVISSEVTSPAYNGGNGLLLWFPTEISLNNSFEMSTAFLSDQSAIRCLNLSGVSLPKNSVVYQTGFNVANQVATIALASAAVEATSKVLGIVAEDIGNGSIGAVLVEGSIQGFNTSTFSIGGSIYLSDTPGAISNVSGNFPVVIGRALTISSSGAIALGFTGGSSSAASPSWIKFAVSYADFSNVTTTNNIELTTLAAGQMLHGIKVKSTVAFSDNPTAAMNSYTISLGVTGNLTKFTSPWDVFQAVGNTILQSTALLACENQGASTSLRIAAVSNVNLNTATAGTVEIWLLISTAL